MMTTIYDILCLLLLLLLLLTTTLFTTILRHPHRTYGPPTYPFIGCLPSFYKNRRRLLEWYTELLASSPTQTISIKRLGVGPITVTANPSNVEYILKTNFDNYPKGKPFSELVKDLLGIGIFNVDGELWSSQRKLASHEFSTRSLKEFVVSALEEEVNQRLIPLLEKACGSGGVDGCDGGSELDLQDILKRFTYDTICKVSLGMDPNCLDLSLPPPPLITAFDTAATICAMRATSPVYAIWRLKRLLNIGTERQLKESVKIVHDSVDQIITNKSKLNDVGDNGTNNHHDLLSRMLTTGMSRELARDMVTSFILAGRDTSSAAMTWLFWLLTQNREVEDRLVSEVKDSVYGFNGDANKKMGYEDLKEMKYMHACLCETMRLYPPVVWDSKHAETDDVLPDGTRVKKGSRVTYFPYGMGRMANLWGENRLEFQPERWFEDHGRGEEEMGLNLKGVSPFVYPVFQAGPRVCLGKEMAFVQMKYVVASVLERFQFEAVSKEKPVFVPLLTAYMAGGFKVRVKRRRNIYI